MVNLKGQLGETRHKMDTQAIAVNFGCKKAQLVRFLSTIFGKLSCCRFACGRQALRAIFVFGVSGDDTFRLRQKLHVAPPVFEP